MLWKILEVFGLDALGSMNVRISGVFSTAVACFARDILFRRLVLFSTQSRWRAMGSAVISSTQVLLKGGSWPKLSSSASMNTQAT